MKIPAGEDKAKCLSLIDEARDERKEFVITKRGVPVARLVPLEFPPYADKVRCGGRMEETAVIQRRPSFNRRDLGSLG